MNGLALLIATATLGLDYGWQPTTDGQLEYIIQIEPVTLVALRGGQELVSQIDPYVQGVRRFRIRVGGEMVPRRGQPPRQPAPPLGLPVPAGVQYGWRSIADQQMEFIIQLSHERLVLMRGGEDLVGEIPIELPNVTQLRVRSGVEPPPRQMPQVASAELAVPQPVGPDPAARDLPARDLAARDLAAQIDDRLTAEPQPPVRQADQPQTTNGTNDAPAGTSPARTPADERGSWSWSSPAVPAGESQWSNESRALTEQPAAQPVQPPAQPVQPQAEAGSTRPAGPNAWQAGPEPESPTRDGTLAPQPDIAAPQPPNFSDWGRVRSSDTADQPAAGSSAPGRSIYDDPTATTQAPLRSTAPPTVPLPYRPQWSTGQSPPAASNLTPSEGNQTVPTTSIPWNMTADPRLPWERRLFFSDFPAKPAAPAKDFWASLAQTAQDPTLNYLRGSDSAETPWGTMTLVLMILFISLGANLYMGWIAVDMYHRYLELADDLTEAESPSRSSLDRRDERYDDPLDDPLDDQDDWDDLPRSGRRARMIA